jgi:DNA-directed RNA polymerase specialized sigma24 family protein
VDAARLRAIRGAAGESSRPAKTEPARAKWVSLPPTKRAEIVARYRAGEPSTVLAREYGVVKATVLEILHRAQVPMRQQPLTESQIAEISHLYENGQSLARIGKQFAVSPGTIHRALITACVAIRPRPGR